MESVLSTTLSYSGEICYILCLVGTLLVFQFQNNKCGSSEFICFRSLLFSECLTSLFPAVKLTDLNI
jgi:hypothetical protein